MVLQYQVHSSVKPFILKIDFRGNFFRELVTDFDCRWKTLSVFISEETLLEESAGAMLGEKLTDEEVLAAHKIIPLRGEPR